MKAIFRVICGLLLAFQVDSVSVAAVREGEPNYQGRTAAEVSKQPVLEDGTPVKLRISQTISSEEAHVGDRVEFEVLEEIRVANTVVISKGGIAWGTVTEAKPKRRMARGGHLDVVMDSVRLVDGEKAALRATKEVKGGGHTGGMVAGIVITGLLIWPAAPFFLFMHGHEITIPKGTEVPTFINGNFPLELTRFQEPTSATSQPQSDMPTRIAVLTQTSSSTELTVTSTPGGADIQLDGSFVGSTPSTIGISSGDHVITISKRGYNLWERKLKAGTGKVNVAAELDAQSQPEQKTVSAAAQQTSATPAATSETAGKGDSESVATISVASDQTGADIYIDGSFVGKAPVTSKLKPGQHYVRAFLRNYKNWSRAVSVVAGGEVRLTVTMEKSD